MRHRDKCGVNAKVVCRLYDVFDMVDYVAFAAGGARARMRTASMTEFERKREEREGHGADGR